MSTPDDDLARLDREMNQHLVMTHNRDHARLWGHDDLADRYQQVIDHQQRPDSSDG